MNKHAAVLEFVQGLYLKEAEPAAGSSAAARASSEPLQTAMPIRGSASAYEIPEPASACE